MTTKQALVILSAHQEWLRGGNGPATDPVSIGMAIDVALDLLKKEVDRRGASGCVGYMKDLKRAAAALGKKGGLKRGPTKARTTEQARKAGLASAAARKAKQ